MAVASSSSFEHGISAGFEWEEAHNSIIEQIALTDVVESDWPTLRNIIKHKLHSNITSLLARPKPAPLTPITESTPADPPVGIEPGLLGQSPIIPSDTDTSPAPTNGLVTMPDTSRPPMKDDEVPEGLVDTVMSEGEGLVDKQEDTPVLAVPSTNGASEKTSEESEMGEVEKEIGNGLGPADVIGGRTLPNWMSESEARFMEKRLQELLDEFSSRPPFTIQRLCELLHNPTGIHSATGKYLRAIERTLLVTSSWSPPILASDSNGFLPGQPGASTSASASASSDAGTPRYANTPIFSPIPFLVHDDDPTLQDGNPPGILMSPLVLGAASTTGVFPSSSASVSTIDLGTSSTTTSTLSAEGLHVDEFDAGVIPSSILQLAEGADASAQPHLLSSRPRSLSSTEGFEGEAGKEEPSSPLGLMRAVELPDLGEPVVEDRRVKPKTDGAEFDELPTGGEKRVVIPPSPNPAPAGTSQQRKVVFESASSEEGEGDGGGDKEGERKRRSVSPTPDPGKIVAAKEVQGEEMKVDLPGEKRD